MPITVWADPECDEDGGGGGADKDSGERTRGLGIGLGHRDRSQYYWMNDENDDPNVGPPGSMHKHVSVYERAEMERNANKAPSKYRACDDEIGPYQQEVDTHMITDVVVGETVVLHGLSMTFVNGQTGSIESYDGKTERFCVRLHTSMQRSDTGGMVSTVNVKLKNLMRPKEEAEKEEEVAVASGPQEAIAPETARSEPAPAVQAEAVVAEDGVSELPEATDALQAMYSEYGTEAYDASEMPCVHHMDEKLAMEPCEYKEDFLETTWGPYDAPEAPDAVVSAQPFLFPSKTQLQTVDLIQSDKELLIEALDDSKEEYYEHVMRHARSALAELGAKSIDKVAVKGEIMVQKFVDALKLPDVLAENTKEAIVATMPAWDQFVYKIGKFVCSVYAPLKQVNLLNKEIKGITGGDAKDKEDADK